MKKRFLLFLIFIMCIISITTFILILNYLDPYEYKMLGIISITITFILWISTLLTILLYFFKKIYYRWRVYVYHVLTSFRQWFFTSLLLFNILWASLLVTWLLSFTILMFLELFIQNLEK